MNDHNKLLTLPPCYLIYQLNIMRCTIMRSLRTSLYISLSASWQLIQSVPCLSPEGDPRLTHTQLTPRCFGFGFTSIYTIVQIYSTRNAEAKQRSHRSIWDTPAALHVVQRLSCINIHPKQQSAQAIFIFHTRSESHFGKHIINFSTRTRYMLQSQTAFSN